MQKVAHFCRPFVRVFNHIPQKYGKKKENEIVSCRTKKSSEKLSVASPLFPVSPSRTIDNTHRNKKIILANQQLKRENTLAKKIAILNQVQGKPVLQPLKMDAGDTTKSEPILQNS